MKQPVTQQAPSLHMPVTVWQKLMAFVVSCPVEVNGFGLIDDVPGGFVLSDVFITEQSAGPAHVDVTPETMGKLMTDMIRRGEDPGRIKFQWHSHVGMAAYFSLTDEANINRWPGDWLFSLVANVHGDYACRLDMLSGPRVTVDITPQMHITPDQDLLQHAAAEIRSKVSRPGVFRPKPITDGKPVPTRAVEIGTPDDVVLGGGH